MASSSCISSDIFCSSNADGAELDDKDDNEDDETEGAEEAAGAELKLIVLAEFTCSAGDEDSMGEAALTGDEDEATSI